MAKQIEDIIVRLGLEKFEGLDKIRSSFRDLSKVTKMSEQDIIGARDSIFEFAKTAGNSEAVTKGLVSALQGLRSQADMCGDAYEELRRDIENVEAASRGYTAQAVAQRASLSAQYGAITNNTEALRRQRTALIELQQATRGGSQLFTQLGTDIQRTTTRLEEIEGIQRRTNATLNRGLPSSSAKIRRDLQDVRDRISLEQAELERLQTLTAAERRQFSQGTELRGQSGVTRAIAEQERILATFRQQAGALDLSENVRQRRQAVRDANALFMSPDFTGTGSRTAEGLTRSFGDLPNTLAGINQGLSELRNRLDNTTIGTTAFTDAAIRAAAAQRELREATQGVAAAFVQQLRTGDIAPSLTNLREVISSVRTEQGLLDTSSTGGARAFQLLERQARSLERQLSALQATQASLAATPVSGFREFSQSITPQVGDAAVQGSIRRNRERQERERRRLEREAADFYSSQPTVPLLLPAAGQTSAPDTGLEISGGANVRAGRRRSVTDVGGNIPVMGVRPGSGVQRFFGSADVEAAALYPGAVPIGPRATSRQEGENRSAVIAEKDARLANSAAIEEQRKRMESLRAAVDKATKANTGSINSLGNLREALANLRNEIPETNGEFKRLTNRLQDVDERSERLSTRASRRLSGMQLAQGVGAALSGGIFGGPEGLIGGLGGLALGGVGGAFAGAAAGAQVGMFRQQLGTVTDYSARIDKLQIALRGIVGSQDAYSQALAAAASVTRDLNIPQEVAIQGMTRLSAAVKGAGGTVTDSAFAFRAVSEAVKATGGNAEQADGALLALTQVFSKGKVSAEELNQIAERLPGTFTLFAKAAGMTGPQLQKALQEGQVGLNDLMKFLQLISTEYGQTALKIADSSQEAGARLSVAMKNMQLEVGRALQPIGASLQSAFADFITKITPSVVSAMKGIAAAFEFLIENKTASGLATFALQLGAVTAGLIALRSAMATLAAVNLAAMFTTTAASAKITGDVLTTTAASAGGLAGKLGAVRTSLGLLAGAAAKPIVITVILAGVTEAILRIREVYKFFGESQRVSKELSGSAWLKNMGGTALNRTQLSNLATQTTNAYNFNRAEVARLTQERETLESQIVLADDNVAASGLRNKLAGVNTGIQTAQTRIKNTKANLDAIYDALNRPKVDAAAGLSTFPTPATDEEKKKKSAADKAARDAQAAAAEQQRLANTLLDQQLNAADRLFQHQIELDRQRYELQKRLDDAQAQNRIMRETGAARDIVSNFEDLQRSLREIEERRVRAVQDVRLAKQTQQTATVRAAFADQGAAALSAGGTGISATAIAKATAEAAKFTGIANQCSEAVKSFYKSLGITLPGVTAWADTVRNAGTVMRDWSKLRPGDIVATGRPGDTPHVGVYTGGNNVFHQSRKRGLTAGNYPDLDYFKSGYFVRPTQSAGTARMPTGAAAQQNRAIRASGGAVIEGLDVNKAEAQLQLIEANVSKERATLFEQFTLKATDALRQQNATMRDSNELQTLRNRLTLEGVRPEFVDLEERLLGIRQEQNQAQTTYNQLVKANPDRAAELQSVLAAQNEQYAERARLLRENAEAAEAFNKAMRTRQDERIGLGLREGAEAYVQSIGTMREATAQLAQTGIKGVEDAIFSLVTTGTANFREFAASILRDTARMIIQQMVLRSIMQIISAVAPGGGGFGKGYFDPMTGLGTAGPNFGFARGGVFGANSIQPFAMGGTFPRNVTAYAMGGIVDKPTLFPFANGGAGRLGLMGEAGPEAIMPLRRLPSGRLGVEAGGAGTGVVVNVNVDAKGTAVESDQSNSKALGEVLGVAVRAELIQQQRPGGLLDPNRRR
jgi:lambda family phage tail tape measure protein